jgi:predicted RNase H-like HicB family nuclease
MTIGVEIRGNVGLIELRDPPHNFLTAEKVAFIADAPELPGCASDGATHQEALANVEVVIQKWIETAKELGRAIPEPKGRLIFA